MTATAFLEGATGEPSNLRRRVAPQWVRGLPANEADYVDYRDNGGPITIENAEIERQIIAPDGEPEANLQGKRNLTIGPISIGDVDPANPGYLLYNLNVLKRYTFAANTPVSGVNRWRLGQREATAGPPYNSLLEDDDVLPRKRVKDLLLGGFNVGATPNGNYAATFPTVAAEFDFHGAPEQTQGGTTAQAITSITRASSTATVTTTAPHGLATGMVVVVSGATQTEYNGNFVITVTGASTFTYTVSGTPATPATGTPVYATSGLSITGITRTGAVATATTAVAHDLATGDVVRISGAVETAYNGDVTVTVLSPTTFTYAVTGTPTTPATGTIVYERLDADVPILAGFWNENLEDDDVDRDIWARITAFDGVNTYTVQAKVSEAETYSSTFTVKRGYDTAGEPIFARMVDQDGAYIGTWAEPVRMHLKEDGSYPVGSEWQFPKRRAEWVQDLDDAHPISSVETAFFLSNENDELEEIRIPGGVQIVGAYRRNERLPDTPGRQGAIVDRGGSLIITVTPSRRITDLRLQKALLKGSTVACVVDTKTSVNIGSTGRPYRDLRVMPACQVWGPSYGVAAGGANKDEAPTLRTSRPTTSFTYDSMTFDAPYTHVMENDLPESVVTSGRPA